jgi:hypothetical protein
VNVNESERERSRIICRQFCDVGRVALIFQGAPEISGLDCVGSRFGERNAADRGIGGCQVAILVGITGPNRLSDATRKPADRESSVLGRDASSFELPRLHL